MTLKVPRVYCRPALTIEQQVKRLSADGMAIPDDSEVKRQLHFISFHRFTDYAYPLFDMETGRYQAGTSFDDVMNIVRFDEALRGLLLPVLERIEVAARAVISNEMCAQHGTHWYSDPRHYVDAGRFQGIIDKIEGDIGRREPRKRSPAIDKYFTDFDDPAMPPSWMVFEALSFGSTAQIYRSLHEKTHQKLISKVFGLPAATFGSWIFAASYLRNLCAHHQRIWNRTFTIKPVIFTPVNKLMGHRNDRLFGFCVMLQQLNKAVSAETAFATKLAKLLDQSSYIPLAPMGFPEKWSNHPHWREKSRTL